jgi:chromosome segregation ATPase
MVHHVAKLEKDLETLKKYAVDYPVLKAKCEDAEGKTKELEGDNEEMKGKLEEMGGENSRNVRALHELQLRYTRVTHDLEVTIKRSHWAQDSQKGQIRALTSCLRDTLEELQVYKRQLREMKGQVESNLRDQVQGLLGDVERELYTTLPQFIDAQSKNVVQALNTKHAAVVNGLKAEVEELKDYLRESENRYERLQNDMDKTKDEYESCLTSQNESTQNITNQLTDLQTQLSQLQTKLDTTEKENQHLRIGERQAIEKWRSLEQSLSSTNSQYQSQVSQLQTQLNHLQSQHASLQSQYDSDKRIWDSNSQTANSNLTRSLQIKDAQIHELNNSLKDLRNTITTLRDERTKTIEAHQSRVKQLQDKYIEMLANKEKEQEATVKEKLIKEFESEKAELLNAQKAIYQKQINDVKATLQAQLDAARLSRDHANMDSSRKMSQLEREWGAKCQKAQDEILELQSKMASMETSLKTLQSQPPPPPPQNSSTLIKTVDSKEMESVKSQLSKSQAEIAFLKETVRMECEERMGLLMEIDKLKRGLANPIALPGVSGGQGRGGSGTGSSKNGGKVKEEKEAAAVADPEMSLYQSMANMAALKKNKNLRPLSANTKRRI